MESLGALALLAIMAGGFATMVGLVRAGTAIRLALLAAFVAGCAPLLGTTGPGKARIAVLGILALLVLAGLRTLVAAVIGERATDVMVGTLAADLIRLIFRAPARLVRLASRTWGL